MSAHELLIDCMLLAYLVPELTFWWTVALCAKWSLFQAYIKSCLLRRIILGKNTKRMAFPGQNSNFNCTGPKFRAKPLRSRIQRNQLKLAKRAVCNEGTPTIQTLRHEHCSQNSKLRNRDPIGTLGSQNRDPKQRFMKFNASAEVKTKICV